MLNNIKVAEKSDFFEELKKFNIGKIAFDVKKYQIVIETEENQLGNIEIFSIEPGGFRDKETQCILKRGFRTRKGDSFFQENRAIIYIPFSNILRSIDFEPFLSYFSDMKSE